MKNIEEEVRNYFFIEKKIRMLTNIIKDLENQILDINEKIKDLSCIDFNKINIKSPNFDSLSSSNNSSSYIENNIMKQIEEKEKLIEKIKEEIENYRNKTENLRLENVKMKNIINLIDDFHKKILELKYSKNKTEIEISEELKLTPSNYHRIKKKSLTIIHNLMVMYKI